MPLPQMLQITTVASATKASSQLLWQLLMALGGQNRADGNDDGAGDNQGKELHHLADAERGDQRAEQHIHKAGQGHGRAGVGAGSQGFHRCWTQWQKPPR